MNDQSNLQQTQTQAQAQAPVDPFGGNMPFANVQSSSQNISVGGPESAAGMQKNVESGASNESSKESGLDKDKLPETYKTIENKDIKPVYPVNQAQYQQNQPQKPQPVVPQIPKKTGPKFFGYMVSPQIANNYSLIQAQKGKGNVNKSRTWIYLLLDRILKKETYK